jgi:hypothetical protein
LHPRGQVTNRPTHVGGVRWSCPFPEPTARMPGLPLFIVITPRTPAAQTWPQTTTG